MLEFAECYTISHQLDHQIQQKIIKKVVANASPHGFAFYWNDPNDYPSRLIGKQVGISRVLGGQIELFVEDSRVLFGDGVNIRYYEPGDKLPIKHQLYLEFHDGSMIICTVQMYGAMWAYPEGQNDSPYYHIAIEKPSPLDQAFDRHYFETMWKESKPTLSIKAFLATEQRIPGLGNGSLQDILFRSKIHPKTKLQALKDKDMENLFQKTKQTLYDMSTQGGRDTEKDLYGRAGGYKTILSSKTLKNPCPVCQNSIVRQPYLGGNVYFCPTCQPIITGK